MDKKEEILGAFNFRHACKEFEAKRKIAEEDFKLILEAGRLSPSSFGFEPWKFLVLQNVDLREKIRPSCWGAQKQLPTASHFVVLLARAGFDMRSDSEYIRETMAELHKSPPEVAAARREKLEDFQKNDFELQDERALFDWACRQTYIALGNMMTAAALLGIDSCPIEGFNRERVEEILAAEGALDRKHFGIACMAAFGYRIAAPKPKLRRGLEEVSQII